jgi:hypothetical protein
LGIVTDYITDVIQKQVDERGLVLWFDPEKHYVTLAENLSLSRATVARFDGSFFALRKEIEPLMGGDSPPRLVVYVPLNKADTHNALVEVEAAGVVMMPRHQPPSLNTRLSIIARNALKGTFGDETAASIEKQVEDGKIDLAGLDELAKHGEGITKGVVTLIFGTSSTQDIALKFLSSARHDEEIVKKEAGAELAMLLRNEFDVDLAQSKTPHDMRTLLARHVLATEFIDSLTGEPPSALSTVRTGRNAAAQASCAALVKTWRQRRDLRESYAALAGQTGKELGLSRMDFELQGISGSETFLEVENALCHRIIQRLLTKASGELVELAQQRQSSFWAEYLPGVQAQWALVAVTGQLLLEAERLEQEVKSAAPGADDWIVAYTEGESPWCMLDTYHRHMERRYHNFDFDSGEAHELLKKAITKARHRYMEVGGALAEQFLHRLRDSKFKTGKALLQTQLYEKKIKPGLAESKTAYVWVDALRFEMGRELAHSLQDGFSVKTEAAVAAVPTITEIGMAALLPGEVKQVIASPAGEGKLALDVDGTIIKDRKDRISYLKKKSGVEFFDLKLEDLLPSPKKRIEEGIRSAQLILVTSQEIDALCEGDNVPLARRTMDEVLHLLHRSFRVLADLGVDNIILAADHGYLFGDELDEGMKIDAPGGDTADLHRRVWVGKGGSADPAYMRARIAEFGLGGDLEIAAPWNFACFKAKGGAKAYFHGGLSPQELLIPVITLQPLESRSRRGPAAGGIDWQLIPGSQKISTRFFSVQIKGAVTGLFEVTPPKVRVEVRAKNNSISTPVSASYGFEEGTGDVQLRLMEEDSKAIEANTVTLAITGETTQKTVTIHLIDATSGVELKRLEKVEMAIAI